MVLDINKTDQKVPANRKSLISKAPGQKFKESMSNSLLSTAGNLTISLENNENASEREIDEKVSYIKFTKLHYQATMLSMPE